LKSKTKTSKFRSGFEERVAKSMDVRCVNYSYESVNIPYTVERKYLPDFELENGILIEVKGYFRSADQRKHKLIKQQHPEWDVRFVFQKLSSRVQGSKMTCQSWCEKYNFLYAETDVPIKWIRETKKTRN